MRLVVKSRSKTLNKQKIRREKYSKQQQYNERLKLYGDW